MAIITIGIDSGQERFCRADLPPSAMQTSSSAHHWARKLVALGLDARHVSVKPGMTTAAA